MKSDQVERFREIAPGVRCSLPMLAGISDMAAEGYRKMPWGGAESGGLLLGARTGECVWVVECREVNCEHDFGPAFELSPGDLRGLEASIEEIGQGPLAVVGWYRTTSRELTMNSSDVELADRYFTESWHLTLIVHRGKGTEPKFGLFVKDPDRTPAHRMAAEFTAQSVSAQPEAGGPKPAIAKNAGPAGPTVRTGHSGNGSGAPRETSASVADDVCSDPPPEALAEHSAGAARVLKSAVTSRPEAAAPKLVLEDVPIVATAVTERSPIGLRDESHPAVEVHREALERLIQEVNPSIATDDWLRFFGLSLNPFTSAPDPAFYFETAVHREALAALEHGIAARKGLIVLTGPTGTGKSMVLEYAAGELQGKRVDCVRLAGPRITRPAMYESIAGGLGVPISQRNAFLTLQELAAQRAANGSTVVVMVDEAHRAPAGVLLELLVLNNLENRLGKLFQIVLAGQPSLNELFDRPEFAALKQRVAVRADIGPLTPKETQDYVASRVKSAGGGAALIGRDAAEAIHRHTAGTPRLINELCAASLRFAFLTKQKPLTPAIIDQAAALPEV